MTCIAAQSSTEEKEMSGSIAQCGAIASLLANIRLGVGFLHGMAWQHSRLRTSNTKFLSASSRTIDQAVDSQRMHHSELARTGSQHFAIEVSSAATKRPQCLLRTSVLPLSPRVPTSLLAQTIQTCSTSPCFSVSSMAHLLGYLP